MLIVNTSYSKSPEFDDPQKWLRRINFYTGVLEQLAINNKVVSIERINYEGEYHQNNVHYYFVQQKKKVSLFPFRMHLLIKKLKPDVVLVHGLIFPIQVIQLRILLGRRVKILVLHRSEKPFIGIKKWLQRLADRFINGYLFASADFISTWKSNINPGKIFETLQVSSSFLPENRQLAVKFLKITGNPIFLWVGSLIPRKDPLTVIRGFAQFVNHHSSAKLYMIYQSDNLLPKIEEFILANNHLKESIVLVGKVDHESLEPWYNGADFFISGSHHEGSGIAVCEAMSCGCIPIVTDIISFRGMLSDKCGLFYSPGDDKELLSALLQSLQLNMDKERNKTLQQFKKELSFEAIVQKIEKVIASV